MRVFKDFRGLVFSSQDRDDNSIIVNNPNRHTLRGIHYQEAPFAQTKNITLISGAARFVFVDVMTGKVEKLLLHAGQDCFVGKHQATGYLTLLPNTTIHYDLSERYTKDSERGFRWNDTYLNIDWGLTDPIINERDSRWPDFVPQETK